MPEFRVNNSLKWSFFFLPFEWQALSFMCSEFFEITSCVSRSKHLECVCVCVCVCVCTRGMKGLCVPCLSERPASHFMHTALVRCTGHLMIYRLFRESFIEDI